MKRACEANNYSLVISERSSASMKIKCSAAESLLRTIATCVENEISLWKLEDQGCRLISTQAVKNCHTQAALRVDCMCLGSLASDPIIACGNNDLSLQIYNNKSNKTPIWEISSAHESYLNDCKFLYSTSEDYGLVSCSDDQTIRVWDVKHQKILVEYKTRSVPVSIATHRDMPNLFWVAEIDGTMKLYDKNSSSPACTLSAASKVPFHQMDWSNKAVHTIGGTDRDKWYVWDWKAGRLVASAGTLCGASGFRWSYSHHNLFTVYSTSEVLQWDTDHLGVGCHQLQQKSKIQDVTWVGDEPCCVIASAGSLVFWNINA